MTRVVDVFGSIFLLITVAALSKPATTVINEMMPHLGTVSQVIASLIFPAILIAVLLTILPDRSQR